MQFIISVVIRDTKPNRARNQLFHMMISVPKSKNSTDLMHDLHKIILDSYRHFTKLLQSTLYSSSCFKINWLTLVSSQKSTCGFYLSKKFLMICTLDQVLVE